MHDWMDFNRDGEVDWSEKVLAAEMLCTSREEHNALFGDDGDFDDDAETDVYKRQCATSMARIRYW